MKKRIALIVFATAQIVGLFCSWFSHQILSSAGYVLWGTGFIVLLPGNILGSLLVEKLFWKSNLAPLVTDLLTFAAVVVINLILWFVAVEAFRFVFGRRRASQGSPTKSGKASGGWPRS